MTLFRSPLLSTVQVVVSLVLALVPAVVRWLRERRLSPDDPALPERLVARRQGDAVVTAACFMLVVAFGGAHAYWAVPLLVVGRTAAAYPLRRRVFGETWSLPAYLTWTARLVVAIWGFWLLLIALPLLVASAGRWTIVTALGVGAVLALWQRTYPRTLLRLLGARPLTAETWPPGFERVLAGARLTEAPAIWRAGPPGARVANALALPSLGESHVLFSETLLDRLNDEERAAVLAHEVSHLELFTPALLRRWQWGSLAAIAAGAALGVYLPGAPPLWHWAYAMWPLAVLVMLASRGRVIRAQETPSDRRAVELSGNAEAVIGGLVKLHETARLPRRWAMAHEQRATHPSLARRIQAIREAAGHAPAQVEFPVVIPGTDGTAVVFEAERVRHLAGVTGQDHDVSTLLTAASTAVSLPWTDVGELRVDARGGRPPRLLLADVRGREWSIALDPAGVAGVQTMLDAVDHRLPSTLPSAAVAPRRARLAVAVVAATLWICLQWTGALILPVLTLIKPSPQGLLASGVAAAAAGVIAGSQATSSARLWLDLVPVLAAAWVLWLAWRWHRAGGPDDRVIHVIAGLAAVGTWMVVLLHTRLDPFDLHLEARRVHALTVLPLAMAAAWAWSAEARFRRASAAWLIVAGVAAAFATTAWLDVIVRDPLLVRGPELHVSRGRLVPLARTDVDLAASELWLSPSGRSFAVAPEPPDEDEEESPLEFTVGTIDGARTIVGAYALRFADDDTIVTLERDGGQLAVKARPVARPADTSWSTPLRGDPWGALSVDPVTRRWRLDQPRSGGLRIVSGTIGNALVQERMVDSGNRRGYVQWLATDAEPIGQAFDYRAPSTVATLARELLQLPWRMPLSLRLPRDVVVRSHFDGTCYQGGPGIPVACVARDGTRSHFWTWDGRDLRAAGVMRREFVTQGRDGSGWLTGWQRDRLMLVDPTAARAIDVGQPCRRGECLTSVTYTGRVLGGLLTTPGHIAVSTYRVEPLTPRSP